MNGGLEKKLHYNVEPELYVRGDIKVEIGGWARMQLKA